MVMKNLDFLGCKEERKNETFFKILQNVDISTENMRALPHDLVRKFSDNELSHKMKINTRWGSSCKIEISKNPRFYFMEKSGWEKFVRDNGLGHGEFLTFTRKGKLRFTVNIYRKDGKEILQPPPQSTAFFASSSRVKTEPSHGRVKTEPRQCGIKTSEPRQGTDKGVNKEKVVLSYLGSRIGESSGAGKHKRKLSSQNPKSAKRVNHFRRDSSSSSLAEFTILIQKSYLTILPILTYVSKDQMPKETTKFKINHPDQNKSWEVTYLAREYPTSSAFSGGWSRLAREYPVSVGDKCKFTIIKPDELLLQVSTP